MLYITFSIGVESIHKDLMYQRLRNFGIYVERTGDYLEKWPTFDSKKHVIYFECFGTRISYGKLLSELETDDIITVLSY